MIKAQKDYITTSERLSAPTKAEIKLMKLKLVGPSKIVKFIFGR